VVEARSSSSNGVGPKPSWESPSGLTVSVVIPAYNEAKNIGWVLRRIPAGVDEVLVVDRCSPDDTAAVAAALYPGVRVIDEPRKGKGLALRTGFEAASCDVVVMIDADGSMDPAEIGLYVDAIGRGHDFVKGSRFMVGGSSDDITAVRAWGNRALMAAANLLYMSRFTDLCYGYMAFRRDVLGELALTGTGFEIETEIVVNAVKANLRICEVPTHELERRSGGSNLHAVRDGRRVLATMLRARFRTWRDGELTLVKSPPRTEPVVFEPVVFEPVVDLTEGGLHLIRPTDQTELLAGPIDRTSAST